MSVVNFSAPVDYRSVEKTGEKVDDVTACEDRNKGLERVSSVECKEGVEEGVEKLRDHGRSVVSYPQSATAVAEFFSAPCPPSMIEPDVCQLRDQIYSQ